MRIAVVITGFATAALLLSTVAEAQVDKKVEVVDADHQNKPDLGASIARQWFVRDRVDMTFDPSPSSVALANDTGAAVLKAGSDTRFLITADYALGHALQNDTAALVEKNGGKVLGLGNTADRMSYLLRVQASKGEHHLPCQRRPRHDQHDQAGLRGRQALWRCRICGSGLPGRQEEALSDRHREAHPRRLELHQQAKKRRQIFSR